MLFYMITQYSGYIIITLFYRCIGNKLGVVPHPLTHPIKFQVKITLVIFQNNFSRGYKWKSFKCFLITKK